MRKCFEGVAEKLEHGPQLSGTCSEMTAGILPMTCSGAETEGWEP
jgi:hypothetical protein